MATSGTWPAPLKRLASQLLDESVHVLRHDILNQERIPLIGSNTAEVNERLACVALPSVRHVHGNVGER